MEHQEKIIPPIFSQTLEAEKWNRIAVEAISSEAALTELYQHFFPRVYQFLMGRVKDETTADEITSNTFLKMYKNLSVYDPDKAAFSTWLFRIATNELSSHFRKAHVRKETEWEESFDPAAEEDRTPEQQFLQKERARELHLALERLPERDRRILQMKYWMDCSNKEIADALGITPNYAGVALSRAKDALKRYLGDVRD